MDPLHQFEILPIAEIAIGGIDFSFTNSAFAMAIAVVLIHSLLVIGMRHAAMVPGRMQSIVEILYQFVARMVHDNAGSSARPYVPFVFAVFTFVLFGNLLGMVPGFFTFTSHIIVTFGLATIVITFVTVLGFVKHGLHFFSLFLPTGAPLALAPVIVPLEMISYLTRPISLSVRLFANMMAGHTMLKVFAGFSVMAIGALGEFPGLLAAFGPVVINVALTAFELLVACLQAYVFAVLTCLYLHDALELH